MAIIHSTALRTAIANLAVDTLDESNTPGALVFLTVNNVEVATLLLSQPAFSNAVAGIATSNSITPENDAAGGIIAKAQLRNGNGEVKLTCSTTATGGGGDITLSSVAIDQHQTVSVTSLTYAAAP